MTMTINDEDQDFIKESIGLQLYLVQKKMEHLKLVEQSLEEMEQKMDNEEEIDWTQMMNLLHVTNLEKGLVEQYKNASNLDIRIGLHQKYSQNPQPWFEWIYEQLNLKEKDEVLELGCGTGELWKNKNLQKCPCYFIRPVTRYGKRCHNYVGEGKGQISYQMIDCRQIPKKITVSIK